MARLTPEHERILEEIGPRRVIELLSPFMTERRIERFRQALANRIVGLTVVVERIYDPHNAAAVVRTCEAMGLTEVHMVEIPGREVSRKVTIGSDEWIDIHYHSDSEQVIDALRQRGFIQLAGIPPEPDMNSPLLSLGEYPRSIPHREIEPRWPIAIWMGNEREGLRPGTVEALDGAFHIPMYGLTQSLNLSVSTAIVVEHLAHLYRETGGPGLTEEEQETRLARFMMQDIRDSLTLLGRLLRSS